MNLKRKTLLAAGIPLLLVVILWVAATLLIRPEAIKEMALDRARDATGYSIDAGNASLRLSFRGAGMRVADLQLAAPDSSQTLTAERIDFFVKIRPLLGKRVELESVIIHRPVFEFVGGAPGDPAPANQSGSPALAVFAVESWSIEKGTYRQRGSFGTIELTGIDLTGGLTFSPESGGDGDVRGGAEAGELVFAEQSIPLPALQAELDFQVSPSLDEYRIPDLVLTAGAARLVLAGAYRQEGVAVTGALQGRMEPVSLADLDPLLPVAARERIRAYQLVGQVALPELVIERTAAGENRTSGSLQVADLSAVLPEAPVGLTDGRLAIRFDPETVLVEEGTALLGDTPVRLTGRVQGSDRQRGRFDLTSSIAGPTLASLLPDSLGVRLEEGTLDLDLLARVDLAVSPRPDVEGTVTLKGLAGGFQQASFRGLSGTLAVHNTLLEGPLQATHLTHQGLELSQVRARARMQGKELELEDVEARAYGGSVLGRAKVRGGEGQSGFTYDANLRLTALQAGGILGSMLPAASRVEGLLGGTVELAGTAGDGSPPLRGLDLDADLAVRDGALGNVPALVSAGRALGMHGVSAERWPFQSLTSSLHIRRGAVVLDSLHMVQTGFGWRLGGSVGLDGLLDLVGTVRADPGRIELPAQLAILAPYVAEADGRIPVDFRLGGSLADPEVILDWDRLVERAGAKAKDEERQKLEEALKEAVEDPETLDALRKRIFGGN